MAGPIVVGVDGSPTARKAAEKAKSMAVALGVPLHVVTAHTEDKVVHVNSGSDQWEVSDADNALYIAEQVASALRGPGVSVVPASEHGKPAEALMSYARRAEADLIVVGNQRMRGVTRVLGSVANSVSHNATCDVYIANTYAD